MNWTLIFQISTVNCDFIGRQNIPSWTWFIFQTSTITNGLIVSDTLTWKRCRLTLAKNPLYTRPLGFLLQKNSNLTEILNKKYLKKLSLHWNQLLFPFFGRRILLLHQAGLMDQIVRRYTPSPKRCLVTERKTNNKLSKLNLLQMSGSFKILVIGMTVSFTCFVVEMVWPKCSRIQIRCNYRRGCVRNCTCTCKRQWSFNCFCERIWLTQYWALSIFTWSYCSS